MPNPENIESFKWQKGQSGNLSGKPKGTKHLSTLLKEALELGDTKAKIISSLLKKAIDDNDLKAIQEIFDRTEGKPKQEIEQSTVIEDERIDLSILTDDELSFLERIQHKSREGKA